LWTQDSTRRVLNSLQSAGGNGKTSPYGEALTGREIELLRYLAKGLKTKQIAGELALSESYVRGQLSTLYSKLGVTGAVQAAAYAVEHKLK
jgi:DNA-binding NarL/FixJ family response regulator